MMPAKWEQIAKKAQETRDAGIPAEWRLTTAEIEACDNWSGLKLIESKLSAEELAITGLTATKALAKLASGELTSVQVTKAICHRTAVAHQITNTCTELFFDRAMARAAELDAQFKANGNKPTGVYHGLPVSIKDDQDHKGTRTTWGFVGWYDETSEQDSAVVQILLKAGAVLYCKTNVPQALMTWESINPLWGHVKNINNLALGAGGSSGGEGCIVSCGASYLGIGSDIGGSIRLPSSINGVYGLKPSSNRLAYCGSRGIASGSPPGLIPSVNGPLARSIEDLAVFTKHVVEVGLEYDPEQVPMPWKEIKLPAKLKFGYFIDTELFRATPPVRRAMEEAVAALKAAGHEVVEFKVEDAGEMLVTATSIFGAYDDKVLELLKDSGEPLIEGLKWMINEDPNAKKATVGDLWDYYNTRQVIRARYLKRMLALDGIICPTVGMPSIEHNKSAEAIPACVYTIMWNLLDLTAGVIPVTKTSSADKIAADFKPANDIEVGIYRNYDPEIYKGAPVGIQIVAKKLEEEKALAMMTVVDEALKKSRK